MERHANKMANVFDVFSFDFFSCLYQLRQSKIKTDFHLRLLPLPSALLKRQETDRVFREHR